MSTFTLEVAGRAVACIRAETRDRAEQRIDDPWFRDGLLGLDNEAPPLWNGEAELQLRSASPEELATVQARIDARQRAGEPLDEDDAVIFLVPEQAGTPSDHRLILASRVEHAPVYTDAGERIGHIDDLSIDRRDGHVVYAIMSFGGFLGIGKHFHPIPWSVLDYDPERGGYVVPLDKAALENAPYYEAEELRELGGPRQDFYKNHILDYYGRHGQPMM
jgi:sporulation protein YlmC with PRC-barrel domain